MDDDIMVGDGYTIEAKRVRGWPCHFYTSFDPAFVTGSAVDDSHVQVFVDFEAEFGSGWHEHPKAQQCYRRAGQIAYQRLSDQIERVMEERRKRWRTRR
jgi:hypothetical protein